MLHKRPERYPLILAKNLWQKLTNNFGSNICPSNNGRGKDAVPMCVPATLFYIRFQLT